MMKGMSGFFFLIYVGFRLFGLNIFIIILTKKLDGENAIEYIQHYYYYLSKNENISVTRITLSLTCGKLVGQDFGDL